MAALKRVYLLDSEPTCCVLHYVGTSSHHSWSIRVVGLPSERADYGLLLIDDEAVRLIFMPREIASRGDCDYVSKFAALVGVGVFRVA